MNLPFSLERTVHVRARRATVFRYFTDSERFAAWWGAGSSIEPSPGGRVVIRYPQGTVASGQVLELVPGERIVFTYGYEDPRKPIAPGGSRVTVTLVDEAGGTTVRLRHDVASESVRDEHAPGWRYQLSLFAVVLGREHAAGLEDRVDAWFRAFGERDAAARRALLDGLVTPDVLFQDDFACLRGIDDLDAHIAAVQRFIPAILERDGAPRACQGSALVRWRARRLDGAPAGTGENLFELDADGRLARVLGFRDPLTPP